MNSNTFTNKRVLELGAGTGLVGITCNIAGSTVVVMTDLPECLPICGTNVKANRDLMNHELPVQVEELRWGDDRRCSDLIHLYAPLDILIGSDIVYHQSPEVLQALVETVKQLSCQKTVFILAYEYRECMIEDEVYFFAPFRSLFSSIEQVDMGGDRWIYIFTKFIGSNK